MRVASLHVHPVKGCRGIALTEAELVPSGMRHDRRFMVVDERGVFVTQREAPRLALVEVAIRERRMTLVVGGATTDVELEGLDAKRRPRRRVRVWDDVVDAVDVEGDAGALLSELVGARCSLAYMPPDVIRPVDPRYARPGDRVGFADGFPVLVASLASLADLEARLGAKVPVDRFRANVWVEGGEPFAEERSASARVGPVTLRMPKPCARCQVITIDQATAEPSKEPLATLASYRATANQVRFAMNAIPDLAPGESVTIRVGDPVSYAP